MMGLLERDCPKMANPTAALLPAPRQQFLDSNGEPLAGGSVTTYVPGTQTLSPTWADPLQATQNANPQNLDGAGSWGFYGDAQVRMLVQDVNGNTVWNGLTQDALSIAQQAATTIVDAALASFELGKISSLNVQGNPALPVSPIGQGSGSQVYATGSFVGTTNQPGAREFLVSINFTSNIGPGENEADDKVALYTAIQGSGQTGDVWAFNPLVYMDSTSNNAYNAQVVEVDLTNFQGDRPSFVPVAAGVQISGLTSPSTNCSTAALVVAGPGTPVWYYGVAVEDNSTKTADFWTDTTASYGYVDNGTHLAGIILTNGTYASAAAVQLGNAQNIVANNAAKTAPYPIIGTSAINDVVVGNAFWGGVIISAVNVMAPEVDNTIALGDSVNRWTAVWAVNGTIQTSDERLKTDISELQGAQALELVQGLKAKSYRWIVGGQKLVPGQVEEEDLMLRMRKSKRDKITIVNGQAVHEVEEFEELAPVVDLLPLVDTKGSSIMRKVREPGGVKFRPRTHAVARREVVKKNTLVPQQVAGKRTHYGFVAQELKALMTGHGLDWGAYVEDAKGGLGIRYEELLPVLWCAVQELSSRVEALTGAPGAPGARPL